MPVLPRRVEFGRLACCCYINDAKMVAGVGIAPTSADLQPAAHLSEPSSDENEMVPPRGDAPRSAGYRPAALLLSYGGEVMRTLLSAVESLAEHQRIALWTPLRGAAVFRTVSSSMPDVLLWSASVAKPARHLDRELTSQHQKSGEWSGDTHALRLLLKLAPPRGIAS